MALLLDGQAAGMFYQFMSGGTADAVQPVPW